MIGKIAVHFFVICSMSVSLTIEVDGFSEETGEIIGTVYRKGSSSRISSAQVRLHGINQAAVTDSAGEFRFENLPAGHYALSVLAEAHEMKEGIAVAVELGKVTGVKLYLEPIPFMLSEVPVTAEKVPATVGRENMEVREIKQMPGTAGDALRALPTFPGIGVAMDFSGELFIRGGGPDDNVFYFDRLPIGYPYHFGGLVSTVSTEVIKGIDVYASGFGAEFGADAQAVIDIHSRRGNRERLAGKFNINMLYSEGMVEGPLGERGTWYVAARRSYLDLLVPLFIDLDADEEVEFGPNLALPRFWDYQARLSYDLNEVHQLTLNAFATSDYFNLDGAFDEQAEIEYYSQKTGFSAQGIHLRSRFTEQLTSHFTLSRYDSITRVAQGTLDSPNFQFENTRPTYQLREDLTYRLNSKYQLESGILCSMGTGKVSSLLSEHDEFDEDFLTLARVDLDKADLSKIDVSQRLVHLEGYLQARYTPAPFISVAVGLRPTYLNFTDELSVDPRASLHFNMMGGLGLRLLYGDYNQAPHPLQIVQGAGNPSLKSSTGKHYVLELEQEVSASTHLKLAGYYKSHAHIITADDASKFLNQGEAFARGAEILLRHRQGDRFFGFLSYAYSRWLRRDQPESPLNLHPYDRPHVATLAGSYNLTPALEIGAKWRYSTGNPYTPTIGFTRIEETKQDPKYGEVRVISAIPVLGDVNSLRVPSYHRLDIRVKRTFMFNRWEMGVFLEFMNVYNRKNIFDFSYPSVIASPGQEYVGESEIEKEAIHQLPFIPYLGVTMTF